MGYIENLREQAEVVRLVAQQDQQQKDQERVFHEQRKKQAEGFWEESRVGVLVSEVRRLFEETGRISHGTLASPRVDPDSIQENICWDEEATGDRAPGKKYGHDVSFGIRKIKSLWVEVLPSGAIIFTGAQKNRIALETWREDIRIVKTSLELSFAHPYIRKYENLDDWESIEPRTNTKNPWAAGFYDGFIGRP